MSRSFQRQEQLQRDVHVWPPRSLPRLGYAVSSVIHAVGCNRIVKMHSQMSVTNTQPMDSEARVARTRSNRHPAARRRGFLRTAVGAGAAIALGGAGTVARAASSMPTSQEERRLSLINDHTWERLDIVYWTHGMYIDESLSSINHLMRDHRANTATVMDVNLLDDLHQLSALFSTKEPLHILSGYRTPETNAQLRLHREGVAKYSLHMEGRAADIYIPGIDTRVVQEAALSLKAGGVGFYGKHGFVHMDTGGVRHWKG